LSGKAGKHPPVERMENAAPPLLLGRTSEKSD
jgi:hypothetical protein